MTSPREALLLLADFSLRSAASESDQLAGYDAVALIAERVAEGMAKTPERQGVEAIAQKAAATAAAIRAADQCQLDFREMLNLGGDGQ